MFEPEHAKAGASSGFPRFCWAGFSGFGGGWRGWGLSHLFPTPFSLQLECKAVMVFFHYCVVSNYFWLFIEGLYLFTLLVETFFPERRYFYWYIIIGWGRSLAGAWAGSGLMARDVRGPAAPGASDQREALPHRQLVARTLLVPGPFLALLLGESPPLGRGVLQSPSERREAQGLGETRTPGRPGCVLGSPGLQVREGEDPKSDGDAGPVGFPVITGLLFLLSRDPNCVCVRVDSAAALLR